MTPLSEKMAAYRGPYQDEIHEKGKALKEAAAGFYGDPQTVSAKKFLGCWARARKAWCEVSGEPLV